MQRYKVHDTSVFEARSPMDPVLKEYIGVIDLSQTVGSR